MKLDKEDIATAKEIAKTLQQSKNDELTVVGNLLAHLLAEREASQPKEPEQEPVAYIHRNEYNEYRLEPHDNFDIKSIPFNVDVLLFKTPQRKPLNNQNPLLVFAKECVLGVYSETELADAAFRAIQAAHGIKENT